MSTQTLTLSHTARSAIVAAFVTALDKHESTGNLVTHVCDIANKYSNGADIPKPDQDAIINALANQKGWAENVIRQRSSEVRTILKACARLPETVKAFAKQTAQTCNWHTAMKLARRLNKGSGTKQAIAEVLKGAGEAGKAHPAGRVAAGLKAWYKTSKADKRRVILQAVETLQTIGLKLELE